MNEGTARNGAEKYCWNRLVKNVVLNGWRDEFIIQLAKHQLKMGSSSLRKQARLLTNLCSLIENLVVAVP